MPAHPLELGGVMLLRLEHVDPAIREWHRRSAHNAAYQAFWAMKYRETTPDKFCWNPLELASQKQMESARSYAEARAAFDEIERQGTQFGDEQRPVEVLLSLDPARWDAGEFARVVAWRKARYDACPGHAMVNTSTDDENRRGWHKGHCKHCGKDMSYDSGD